MWYAEPVDARFAHYEIDARGEKGIGGVQHLEECGAQSRIGPAAARKRATRVPHGASRENVGRLQARLIGSGGKGQLGAPTQAIVRERNEGHRTLVDQALEQRLRVPSTLPY